MTALARTTANLSAAVQPAAAGRPGIAVAGLGKVYPGADQPVLSDISLQVARGEIFAIVGPSGGGKSTLLRIVAGLERCTHGSVSCTNADGRPARALCVFQDYSRSLLPWRTVLANVALPLESRAGVTRARARELARPFVADVGLDDVSERYPWQLSGGMQQRVAIARALAARPDVLLLDEPFGALDALTRMELQNLLLDVWTATGVTVVVVTHDVDEAVYLSSRVAVLAGNPGRIVAIHDTGLDYPRDAIATREQRRFIKCRSDVLAMVMSAAGARR